MARAYLTQMQGTMLIPGQLLSPRSYLWAHYATTGPVQQNDTKPKRPDSCLNALDWVANCRRKHEGLLAFVLQPTWVYNPNSI